jgi:hypothetical protein
LLTTHLCGPCPYNPPTSPKKEQQLQALLGKVVGRLMKPEQLSWKAIFDDSLARTNAPHHMWRLGCHLIFSTLPLARTGLPQRACPYISAYRALAPPGGPRAAAARGHHAEAALL